MLDPRTGQPVKMVADITNTAWEVVIEEILGDDDGEREPKRLRYILVDADMPVIAGLSIEDVCRVMSDGWVPEDWRIAKVEYLGIGGVIYPDDEV